ncbi:MAG TPA: hypothetical protein VGL40_11140 [Bacillota bacterium]|jgi:hypothetical protein
MFRRWATRPPKAGGAHPVTQEKITTGQRLDPKEKRFLLEMHRNAVQDEEFALFEEPISGWWSNDWVIDQEDPRLDDP